MRIKGSPECNIKVNGTTLKTVNEFKYVGDLDKIREIYSLSQRSIPQNDISAFLLVQNPIYTLPWIVFLMFIFTFIVYCLLFQELMSKTYPVQGEKKRKTTDTDVKSVLQCVKKLEREVSLIKKITLLLKSLLLMCCFLAGGTFVCVFVLANSN